jgi:uncharacterized protein YwgA
VSIQIAGGIQQTAGQLYYPSLTGQSINIPAIDKSLEDFLGIIADKSDTDSCIAFVEKQRQLHSKQIQEIERLQKLFQDDLEKAEKEFLSKCQKYRPSITSEMLSRVRGLKAFF